MKAGAYRTPGPIEADDALLDIMLDKPAPDGRDLLVQVHAVSVNPVDAKVRQGTSPEGEWRVLGFDAAGVVAAVGPDVRDFEPGDAVYYAGSIGRPGTNAEYHLVDERIVGAKPTGSTDAQAAALPLTAITAWEMLFDRLDVNRPTPEGGDLILVIGGAGGVGSIAIQLLRALTDLTVVATASRPDTQDWVRECGAQHVIDHRSLLGPQLDALAFKRKAVSLHWEFMFARPLFLTPDMPAQGRILNEVAALVDAGRIRSTVTEVAGTIDARNLRAAHAKIESGTARGKIVLEGF